MVKIALY